MSSLIEPIIKERNILKRGNKNIDVGLVVTSKVGDMEDNIR